MAQFPSRSIYEQELNTMSDSVLRLGSMVNEAIENAFMAMANRDSELAQSVINGDAEINQLRFQIEELAQKILATQQPTARDLRFIIAAIHTAVELERIGDHAAGIARIALRIQATPSTDLDLSRLPKMAHRAEDMLSKAMEAFATRDVEIANKIVRRDQKLDRHYREFFTQAMAHMSDPERAEIATYMLWVAHNLERIGDRATNIAERVIFMVTGQYTEVLEEYA
ncbi:MAG: phosphate signaling complex protein PhoU [Chloroflexota bacterium]